MTKPIRSLLRHIYNFGGKLYLYPMLKYESKHPTFFSRNERAIEYGFTFNHISKLCPDTLLDIGTGISAFPNLVANCGIKVTAIDKIKGYWKGSFFNRHFRIENGDITTPDLNQQFDFVTCISVLEHIPEHLKAVKGMFSLVKKGGYLVLTFPFNENNYNNNVHKDKPNLTFVTQVYSRNEINEWLKDSDMQIINQEYYNVFNGEFWGQGTMTIPPIQVNQFDKSHLTCILLKKSE